MQPSRKIQTWTEHSAYCKSTHISYCENGRLSEEMQFLLNYLYYYNENVTNVFYLSPLLTAKILFKNIK